MKRTSARVLVAFASVVLVAGGTGCTGAIKSGNGNPGGSGTGGGPGGGGSGSGGSGVTPGDITGKPMPVEPVAAQTMVRKVKNLLVGLAPTNEDVATVTATGAAGMQQLINTWMTDPQFQDKFRDKMVFFFRNLFQQTGFTATEDFKLQLLENGGFDFGPLGTNAVGDDAFARLVRNLQDSFALTAWGLVSDGRPFNEVLTTRRYMMTTALKSLYIQIEMPNDQPFNFGAQNTAKLAWKVDMSGTPIPLEQTLDPNSPNYMVFDDQAPTTKAGFGLTPTCQGNAQVNAYSGYAQLFQRLLGYTPRYPFSGNPDCWEHASKPYFTTDDLTDWKWVDVRALGDGESYIQPYDLPKLRAATEIAVKLPRVGYYTTPAFLALWNTNDSNQHRVTATQTLLVALGQSFTASNALIPLSVEGLDAAHATDGSECYGCHKNLDTMRQFWANQFDFNDRNDFPTRTFGTTASNPRPKTTGGVFAFGDVNMAGANMLDFGPLLAQVTDRTDPANPINRFAIAVTQQLCFFANSAQCVEADPEFRRIAKSFQDGNFNLPSLIKELFSSPLVTGSAATTTTTQNGMVVSIARRDQFCASLSNRLGMDVCAASVPLPSSAQSSTIKIATSIAADTFSRGSEQPVTPTDPTLFFRAATEMLCENVANQVVDATTGTSVYASTDVDGAIADMVERIIGYPTSDTAHHDQAIAILKEHYDAAKASSRTTTATTALRSTFALACQSPTSLSFGL